MAELIITDSDFLSKLVAKITASFCDGKFHVDLSSSQWIGGGDSYVEGADVKIKSPLGVLIKDYLTSGHDIEPPMSDVYEFNIPLTAANFQYGTYLFSVKLTDGDGNEYEIEDIPVKICAPDKKDKTKKKGCLGAKMDGDCVNGKLKIIIDTPPNYQGKMVESQENDFQLLYPTVSEVEPFDFTLNAIIVQLYEGEYKLTGTVCATYNLGNDVYVEVLYDVKCSKNIKCIIDFCCVEAKLAEFNAKLKTDCTDKEREQTSSVIFDTMRLLDSAKLAANCGKDPSDLVSELENLLGCVCTCTCNEGVPIINNAPVLGAFDIEGCGVEKTTEGDNTLYTINNYDHKINIDNSAGFLEISDPVVDENECLVEQTISFNADRLTDLVNCDTIAEVFNDNDLKVAQNNEVDPASYEFLGRSIDKPECLLERISPPTGFAITGANRVSAFGKMEWYDTLTLANAALADDETLLIFANTTEDLVAKPSGNYVGIGIKTIGNLTAANARISLQNLKISDCTVTGISQIFTNGVQIDGDFLIQNTAKWFGGKFYDNSKSLTLENSAQVEGVYSERHIGMSGNTRLLKSKVYYTDVAQIAAVYADNSVANSNCIIQDCHIEATGNTIHGIATHSALHDARVTVLSSMGISSSGYGIYFHGGQSEEDGGHTTANGCIGRSTTSHGIVVASNTPAGSTQSLCQWLISNCSGFSVSGSGITLINGNIKHCHGYSVNASGILVGGGEENSFNNLITECTGESVEANGLYAQRDIYVVGGTFISNKKDGVSTTVGNPIRLGDPNARVGYFIAGARTISANTAAYAIRGTADVTARISGCQFLSQTTLTNVPGIDPLITLRDVDIDYYGNIS